MQITNDDIKRAAAKTWLKDASADELKEVYVASLVREAVAQYVAQAMPSVMKHITAQVTDHFERQIRAQVWSRLRIVNDAEGARVVMR